MLLVRILLTILCVSALPSRGHVVEQIYSEWREVGEGWELEVQFDAGYADALTRDDPTAPAPTRDWLLERTEPEWEEMRREAERYFRAYFLVTNNGYPVDWQVSFPDWEVSPPRFPELFNGGGYFRMLIKGSKKGRVELAIREGSGSGSFPKLVVANDGQFLVLSSGDRQTLRDGGGGARVWLLEGFRHVVPLGWDHVLFVLGLFFYRRRLLDLIHQSLAFTVAHSLTLGLAASGVLMIPVDWSRGLEVLIALSLVFIGLENLRKEKKLSRRLPLVFALGLLHGLGFAGALASFVDKDQLIISVGILNLGVELAQIFLLSLIWVGTLRWHQKACYEDFRKWGSILIAIAGAYWALLRI